MNKLFPQPTIKDIEIIYSVLTDEEKSFLESNHSVINYKHNQLIYKDGDEPTGLLCIGSGTAKVFKEGIGGRDQIVRMAKSPGLLGYRALFANSTHIASAVAIDSCTIFHIPKNVIDKLMQKNNELCRNIIHSFATELGFSRYRTVTLTQKHIRGRLAESLLLLKDIYGFKEDGKTLDVLLTREDLANFSNMTTSNAIRTLTNFAKENVITVEGRIIKILDEDTLEKISKIG